MTVFLGPAIGPAVGGFAAEFKGWRWTQWTILFFGLGVWIFSLGQRETYGKVILRKRAQRLGLPPAPSPIPPGLATLRFLLIATITRPLHMLITEPIVGLYSLYTAFNFAVLFSFFAAFPGIFQGTYGFSISMTGLTFFAIAVGCFIGAALFTVIDRVTYSKRVIQSRASGDNGMVGPEHRLYGAMLGSLLLPIGLFWFAWSSRADTHWISPVIATVPFACGNLLVFVCLSISYTSCTPLPTLLC
jgi:MFS family permease